MILPAFDRKSSLSFAFSFCTDCSSSSVARPRLYAWSLSGWKCSGGGGGGGEDGGAEILLLRMG